MERNSIVSIANLTVQFFSEGEWLTAVDDVSFSIPIGATLGLIGESGCGKSVTALSILRLVPNPPGRISSGNIFFGGGDILRFSAQQMHELRGKEISMIFQEPSTSLNPVYTIGKQLKEVYDLHYSIGAGEKKHKAVEMLNHVGIPDASNSLNLYPHELSGGMKQRVMIAMALACSPKLLIADEPTTALDVTIQAQVLELIKRLKDEFKMSVLFITHDLGIVAQICDEVVVMYAGRVMERAKTRDLFTGPMHPYSKGLLDSLPKKGALHKGKGRLPTIDGSVPDISNLPTGCRFVDRCNRAQDRCRNEPPALMEVGDGRSVACFFPLSLG